MFVSTKNEERESMLKEGEGEKQRREREGEREGDKDCQRKVLLSRRKGMERQGEENKQEHATICQSSFFIVKSNVRNCFE